MNHDDTAHAARVDQIAALVQIALQALSMRLVTILVLLLDAGAFGWAMNEGGGTHLACAVAFAVVAWGTVHLKAPGGHRES